MQIEFDKGPTASMANLLMDHPDYTPVKEFFWFNWGPTFYRGRLQEYYVLLPIRVPQKGFPVAHSSVMQVRGYRDSCRRSASTNHMFASTDLSTRCVPPILAMG